MESIIINTKPAYPVLIGPGLLQQSGRLAAPYLPPCRIAIISDDNVAALYLPAAEQAFRQAGYSVVSKTFPAGESSKNFAVVAELVEFLAESGLTRQDAVAALGGGVTGDIAGLAAGLYLRGLRYLQLPTTLLAAVDAAVGGKTAIDLPAGKNLAGLFIQPQAVICDIELLSTLPASALADGWAEAIKTAVLAGPQLFALVDAEAAQSDFLPLISGCVAYKGALVEEDERDVGPRQLLNLGHTVAHAVEKLSHYQLRHGQAVSIGLATVSRIAERLGLCPAQCRERIIAALLQHQLPVNCAFSAAELAEAALADKKRRGESITLVLPRDIGCCILKEYATAELESLFRLGLES